MERKMRIVSAISAIVLLSASPMSASAGSFNEAGQFVGNVSPQVTRVIASFPAGGPALSAAIARMVMQNPDLAADVVYAAQSSTNPQVRQAAGAGLAQAMRFFASCQSCRPGSGSAV